MRITTKMSRPSNQQMTRSALRNLYELRAHAEATGRTEIGEGDLAIDLLDLEDGLGRLSRQDRNLLLDRYVHERTLAEMAGAWGVPSSTISDAIGRALASLTSLVLPEAA